MTDASGLRTSNVGLPFSHGLHTPHPGCIALLQLIQGFKTDAGFLGSTHAFGNPQYHCAMSPSTTLAESCSTQLEVDVTTHACVYAAGLQNTQCI